jgi:polyphenol oxidase
LFCLREDRGRAAVAITDRHDGVSAPPFDSLNLGTSAGDEVAYVERNLALVADSFGADPARMVLMSQVHGADVSVVREASGPTSRPRADALVTDVPGLTLVVRVADCVPVLLADAEAGLVGCAHAGRQGVLAGVVPSAVKALRELGSGSLTAWVGPHVCGACYEVPADLQEEVAGVVPETRSTTSWGTPALDLGAGVRAQLSAAGCDVVDAARCTRESEDLFSYRRDGKVSGRFAGLVRIRPEGDR